MHKPKFIFKCWHTYRCPAQSHTPMKRNRPGAAALELTQNDYDEISFLAFLMNCHPCPITEYLKSFGSCRLIQWHPKPQRLITHSQSIIILVYSDEEKPTEGPTMSLDGITSANQKQDLQWGLKHGASNI